MSLTLALDGLLVLLVAVFAWLLVLLLIFLPLYAFRSDDRNLWNIR